MPKKLTVEGGDFRVMTTKLMKLVSGKPGSLENPAEYEEYEGPKVENGRLIPGEIVTLTAEEATRHSQHTVPVFVNPTSDFDRRVRLVPAVIPVGREDEVLASSPAPAGVAVVVPPSETPQSAIGAQADEPGKPGTPAETPQAGPTVTPEGALTRSGPAGTQPEEPTGTPPS